MSQNDKNNSYSTKRKPSTSSSKSNPDCTAILCRQSITGKSTSISMQNKNDCNNNNNEKRRVNFNFNLLESPLIAIDVESTTNQRTNTAVGLNSSNSLSACSTCSRNRDNSNFNKETTRFFNGSTKSGSSNSSASSSSRKSPKSSQETKHKIWLFDSANRRSTPELSSPYLCHVIKHHELQDKYQPTEFKEIYVSDREFKLLQSAFRSQQRAKQCQPSSSSGNSKEGEYRKTLFGYVHATPPWNTPRDAKGTVLGKSSGPGYTTRLTRQNPKLQNYTKLPPQNRAKTKPKRVVVSKRFVNNNKFGNANMNRSNASQRHLVASKKRVFNNIQKKELQIDTDPNSSKESLELPLGVENAVSFFLEPAGMKQDNSNASESNDSKSGNIDNETSLEMRTMSEPMTMSADKSMEVDNDRNQIEIPNRSIMECFNNQENENAKYQNTCKKFASITNLCSSNVDEADEIETTGTIQIQNIKLENDSNDTRIEHKNPSAEAMVTTMMAASEASVILMNTLFRDALNDPNSSKVLKYLPSFQKFVKVQSKVDALKTASAIFRKASKSIDRYLTSLDALNEIALESTEISCASENNRVEHSTGSADTNTVIAALTDAKPENGEAVDGVEVPVIRSQEPSEGSADARNRREVTLPLCEADVSDHSSELSKISFPIISSTLAHGPGLLQQTIICKGYELKMNYVGTSRTVKSLISSSRTSSKLVALTPLQLIEMVDQTLPFISVRLKNVKHGLHQVTQKIGVVVEEYTSGRHGHYSKSLKKAMMKLRGLNIFAGIILQMSQIFTSMFEKLQQAMSTLTQLVDILKANMILNLLEPVFHYQNEQSGEDGKLISFLEDIENAIEVGKNSLAGIHSKTLSDSGSEVIMKQFLRKIIEDLFKIALQLKYDEEVDFGSLVVSSVWNTKQLVNIVNSNRNKKSSGTVDICIRKNILNNLDKIKQTLRDLSNISGRMTYVSGFLTSKSMLKLKRNKEAIKITEDKKNQLKLIPWYKRQLFSNMIGKSYSLVSIPSTTSPNVVKQNIVVDDPKLEQIHFHSNEDQDPDSETNECEIVRKAADENKNKFEEERKGEGYGKKILTLL